jgi:hypothetical protein
MKKLALIIVWTLIASAALASEPAKIGKSQVGPSFQADVTKYAADLAEWKAHMAKVAADKAAGVPKEKANAPYPAPVAPPLVAGALDETGKPNFAIIDDSPPPPSLADKKAALITQVRLAEAAAVRAIVPEGKQRALGARQNSIMAADGEREAAALAAQPVGVLSPIGIGPKKDPGKAHADAIAARPAADAQFMADQDVRAAKLKAIESAAIQAESDIEDLTDANIDAWNPPKF